MTLDLHVAFEGKAYKSYQTKIPTSSLAMVDPINMKSYGGCVEVIPPCEEPVVTGANILRDPSFDILPAGTGPLGDEIPFTFDGGGLVWPSEGIGAPTITAPESTGWAQGSGAGSTFWKIDNANPLIGARHARYTGSPSDSTARTLRAVGFLTCEKWSTERVPVTGRLEPGRTVTFTARSMVNDASGPPRIQLQILCLMQVGGLFSVLTSESLNITLTTSYAAYTHQASAPAGSYYLSCRIRGTGMTSKVWDVDHCQVSVV